MKLSMKNARESLQRGEIPDMKSRYLGDPFLKIQDEIDNVTLTYLQELCIIALGNKEKALINWDAKAASEVINKAIEVIQESYGIKIVYP